MPKNVTLTDADAFIRRFKLVLGGAIAIIVIPFLIYVLYIERRFGIFEDSMQQSQLEALQVAENMPSDLFHLAANPVEGQIVYVPAYSHVYHGEGTPYLLTITLSVRNTSMASEIIVKSVRYFDTKGREVRSYLKKPVRLPSLGTTEVLVKRDDTSGGSGANFLVEWYSETPVTEPIVEAIMIDTKSSQGISFARRGSVISEISPQKRELESADSLQPANN